MVISACRIFSFMRNYSNTWFDDSDLETQMVEEKLTKKAKISSVIPCDSIVVANNNNYILHQDKSTESGLTISRWSSSCNWTWNSSTPEIRIPSYSSKDKKAFLISVLLSVVLLGIVATVYLGLKQTKFSNNLNSTDLNLSTNNNIGGVEDPSQPIPVPNPKTINKVTELNKVSRISWEMLNRNSDKSKSGILGKDESQEIILPSNMVKKSYSSTRTTDMDLNNSENTKYKKRCCKTKKQSQVITEEGCESKIVVNRICEGKCLSVWIPGYFSSFPVCKPSRSVWKTITLACGKNRDSFKKVKYLKIKRCSCMEPEP